MLYGPTAGIASFLAYCSGDMLRTRELLGAMEGIDSDWMVPAVSCTVAASVAFLDRRYDDAAEHFAETLTYYDEPTSPKLLNVWLGANALWYAGRRSDALAQYQQLRLEADSVGDRYNVSLALRFEAMVGAAARRPGPVVAAGRTQPVDRPWSRRRRQHRPGRGRRCGGLRRG